MALVLTSPAFADNGAIQKQYTCEGADISPPLNWSKAPQGTKTLALIVDDPLDEHGADNPKVREDVDEAISLYTARCMKAGKRGPVLIVASRFHPDDPIGRRLQRTAVDWVYVHHAALLDEGTPGERAFAPLVWPVEELKRVRLELAEKDPITLIKLKEIYEFIEATIDCCEDVADVLQNVEVKNS